MTGVDPDSKRLRHKARYRAVKHAKRFEPVAQKEQGTRHRADDPQRPPASEPSAPRSASEVFSGLGKEFLHRFVRTKQVEDRDEPRDQSPLGRVRQRTPRPRFQVAAGPIEPPQEEKDQQEIKNGMDQAVNGRPRIGQGCSQAEKTTLVARHPQKVAKTGVRKADGDQAK